MKVRKVIYVEQETPLPDGSIQGIGGLTGSDKIDIYRSKIRWWISKKVLTGWKVGS